MNVGAADLDPYTRCPQAIGTVGLYRVNVKNGSYRGYRGYTRIIAGACWGQLNLW